MNKLILNFLKTQPLFVKVFIEFRKLIRFEKTQDNTFQQREPMGISVEITGIFISYSEFLL